MKELLFFTFTGFAVVFAILFTTLNYIQKRRLLKHHPLSEMDSLIHTKTKNPLRWFIDSFTILSNVGVGTALSSGMVTIPGVLFIYLFLDALIGSERILTPILIASWVAEFYFALHVFLVGGFAITGFRGINEDIKRVNQYIINGKLKKDLSAEDYRKLMKSLTHIPIYQVSIGFVSVLSTITVLAVTISYYHPDIFDQAFYDITSLMIAVFFILVHCFYSYFVAEVIISPWMVRLKKIMRQKEIEYTDKAILNLTARAAILFTIVVIAIYGTFIFLFKSQSLPALVSPNLILLTILIAVALCLILFIIIFGAIIISFRQTEQSITALANNRERYLYPVLQDNEIIKVSDGVNYAIDKITDFTNQQFLIIEKLQKFDRMKDDFLANTSHELRTPLNGIIGLADILLDGGGGEVNEKQKSLLELIVLSGNRLDRLVNDILDFAKIKNKELSLRWQPVDLYSIVEIVLQTLTPLLSAKPVQFENKIDQSIPMVYGDENRIEQIITNLISNAIKFTHKGKITITAQEDSIKHILEVSVSDTGIGIPEDKQELIFQSFIQVDPSISRGYSGTGLGLSITKQLVELHTGRIWVSSTLGEGSCFTFTLPLHDKQLHDEAEAERKEAPLTMDDESLHLKQKISSLVDTSQSFSNQDHPWMISKKTDPSAGDVKEEPVVLVVDDELINREVVSNHLQMAGYKVRTACDGYEALEILKNENLPDVVLLDIMMPKLSGYEVGKIIRERYSLSELPILMLTAKTQQNDIITGLKAGANDYLTKPFDKQELLVRVETMFSLKKAIRSQNKLASIQRELDLAYRLQYSILPKTMPQSHLYNIVAKYVPATIIGGDFYDFHCEEDHRLTALIADVSGHGIPAAIIAASFKIAYNSVRPFAEMPYKVLDWINMILLNMFETNYITANYVFLDMKKRVLINANAGHPPLLIYKKNQQQVQTIKPRGTIISLFSEVHFEQKEIPLDPGDKIILYTDGVTEALNSDGTMFSLNRLMEYTEQNAHLKADDFSKQLYLQLNRWIGQSESFEDDVTWMVIDIL